MISYQKSYRLKSVREGGILLHLLAITLLLEWDLTLLAVDIAISLFVRPSVRPRFLVRSIFLLLDQFWHILCPQSALGKGFAVPLNQVCRSRSKVKAIAELCLKSLCKSYIPSLRSNMFYTLPTKCLWSKGVQ